MSTEGTAGRGSVLKTGTDWVLDNLHEAGVLAVVGGTTAFAAASEMLGRSPLSSEGLLTALGLCTGALVVRGIAEGRRSQRHQEGLVAALAQSDARHASMEVALASVVQLSEAAQRRLFDEIAALRSQVGANVAASTQMAWYPDNAQTWSGVRNSLRTHKARWLNGQCVIDPTGRVVVSGDRLRAIRNRRLDRKSPLHWQIFANIPPVEAELHEKHEAGVHRLVAIIAACDHYARLDPEKYSTDNIRLWISPSVENRAISFTLTDFAPMDNRQVAISYNVSPETWLCETLRSVPTHVLVDSTPRRVRGLEETWSRAISDATPLTVAEFLDLYRERIPAGAEILDGMDGEIFSSGDHMGIPHCSRVEILPKRTPLLAPPVRADQEMRVSS